MCTAIQFLFACRHQATGYFRVRVCNYAGSPSCQIKKTSIPIPKMCHDCKRGAERIDPALPGKIESSEHQHQHKAILTDNYVWHIPTRCFHDPGFTTLDPFAADRAKQRREVHFDEQISCRRIGTSIRSNASSLGEKWHEFKKPSHPRCFQEQLSQSLIGGCCNRHKTLATHGRPGWARAIDARTFDDRCTSLF